MPGEYDEVGLEAGAGTGYKRWVSDNTKSISHCGSQNAGYTLIELLEFIFASFLARLLAERVASHIAGVWHTPALWTITILGTLVFGFSIIIGQGYIRYFFRRKKHKPDVPVSKAEP